MSVGCFLGSLWILWSCRGACGCVGDGRVVVECWKVGGGSRGVGPGVLSVEEGLRSGGVFLCFWVLYGKVSLGLFLGRGVEVKKK